MIERITDSTQKQKIARTVLEQLTVWFENPEGREHLIADSGSQIMLADIEGNEPHGFICLKETGKDTVEIAVLGVLSEYHRNGIGRALCEAAKKIAADSGYSFIQVKTVKLGMYECYDKTNLFYRSLGFKEFEVMPELWDELNPCQIYVMAL